MTFLNPLFFIALAAASIPILLHLLNLRKSRVIDFSTLTFLKELQKSKIRRLKIRQWILLALRTLIIVFLVLAFTRPAMRSSFGFLPGTTAKTSVVIILDDSFSMTSSDEHGQLLKQARDAANAILDLLQPGDEAAIVRVSDTKKDNIRFTSAFQTLRGDLEALRPSPAHIGYNEALASASMLMQKSANINKEVYLLTDNQRSQYIQADNGRPMKMFDATVKFYLMPFGGKPADNYAVTAVRMANAVLEKEKPAMLVADIANHGSTPIRGGVVSVFLSGERVVQKSVDIEPGATRSVEFTITPHATGFIDGSVEIEDDVMPEDNKRWFTLHVPENLRVALGPSGGLDGTILRLALQASRTQENPGSVALTEFDRNALESANLEKFDVLVLKGAAQLSQSFRQRVAAWVRNGGGLLVFPDAEGQADAALNPLLAELGIPKSAGMAGSTQGQGTVATFAKTDFDHPLFATMFEKLEGKKPEIESPQIRAMVRLRMDDNAQAVITTTSGDAFFLDCHVGRGRAMVCAVSPSPEWSDLAVKGVFVPLLHRSLFLLASREDDVLDRPAGLPFELVLPASLVGAETVALVSPTGTEARITPRIQPSGAFLAVDGLDEPGVYAIKAGGAVIRKIAVNIDPAESNFEKMGDDDRRKYFADAGIDNPATLGRDINVREAITQMRYGVELWKYFVLLAILCAAIEMAVARDFRRLKIEN